MQQVAEEAVFSSGSAFSGTTYTFTEGDLIATVTSITQTTITSVANGIVSQTTDGYTLECVDIGGGAITGIVEISIPGKLIQKQAIHKHFGQIFALCLIYR